MAFVYACIACMNASCAAFCFALALSASLHACIHLSRAVFMALKALASFMAFTRGRVGRGKAGGTIPRPSVNSVCYFAAAFLPFLPFATGANVSNPSGNFAAYAAFSLRAIAP